MDLSRGKITFVDPFSTVLLQTIGGLPVAAACSSSSEHCKRLSPQLMAFFQIAHCLIRLNDFLSFIFAFKQLLVIASIGDSSKDH